MDLQTAVGPELAAALASVDPASLVDADKVLTRALAWERLASWVAACKAEELARFDQLNNPIIAGSNEQEYALAAHLSVGQAGFDLSEARGLTGPLSPIRDGLALGDITMRHVRAMLPGLRSLVEVAEAKPAEQRASALARVTAVAERISRYAATHTPAETRGRLRRWLITAERESAQQRHERALRRLDVTHEFGEDGIGYLTLSARVDLTMRIFKSLDLCARADAQSDDSDDATKPTLGCRRSELMTELLLDACRPGSVENPPLTFTTNTPPEIESGPDARFRSLIGVDPLPVFQPGWSRSEVRDIYGGYPPPPHLDPDEPCRPPGWEDWGEGPVLQEDIDPPDYVLTDPPDHILNEPWPDSEPPPDPGPTPTNEEWLEWLDRTYPNGLPLDDHDLLGPCRSTARGRFSRRGVRPYQVAVTVDLPTLLGLADHPALLDGTVPVTSTHVRKLFTDADFVRFLIDSQTGQLRELGAKTYRPSQQVELFVKARDPICRVPGCAIAAQHCQLDHEVAFNHENPDLGGLTTTDNLGPLCQRQHQLKTHGGYSFSRTADNQLEFTTPLGRRYLCEPYDHRTWESDSE